MWSYVKSPLFLNYLVLFPFDKQFHAIFLFDSQAQQEQRLTVS